MLSCSPDDMRLVGTLGLQMAWLLALVADALCGEFLRAVLADVA
jgi:hypothetical protein